LCTDDSEIDIDQLKRDLAKRNIKARVTPPKPRNLREENIEPARPRILRYAYRNAPAKTTSSPDIRVYEVPLLTSGLEYRVDEVRGTASHTNDTEGIIIDEVPRKIMGPQQAFIDERNPAENNPGPLKKREDQAVQKSK
jgi:hypothetical protein